MLLPKWSSSRSGVEGTRNASESICVSMIADSLDVMSGFSAVTDRFVSVRFVPSKLLCGLEVRGAFVAMTPAAGLAGLVSSLSRKLTWPAFKAPAAPNWSATFVSLETATFDTTGGTEA